MYDPNYINPKSGIRGHYSAPDKTADLIALGEKLLAPRTVAPVAQDAVSRLTLQETALLESLFVKPVARVRPIVARDVAAHGDSDRQVTSTANRAYSQVSKALKISKTPYNYE